MSGVRRDGISVGSIHELVEELDQQIAAETDPLERELLQEALRGSSRRILGRHLILLLYHRLAQLDLDAAVAALPTPDLDMLAYLSPDLDLPSDRPLPRYPWGDDLTRTEGPT